MEDGFTWEKFIDRVKFQVSVVTTPLPQLAWVHLISQFFRVDKDLSHSIFEQLINDDHLLFIGRQENHNIYINVKANTD